MIFRGRLSRVINDSGFFTSDDSVKGALSQYISGDSVDDFLSENPKKPELLWLKAMISFHKTMDECYA